jgi:hypothetical protein
MVLVFFVFLVLGVVVGRAGSQEFVGPPSLVGVAVKAR